MRSENTYSVGTRRIGYSLASDQVINMQRIITKWCVVRQNCVKYIMNWYSQCLLADVFSFLQHPDTEALYALRANNEFHSAHLFWCWNVIDLVALVVGFRQGVAGDPTGSEAVVISRIWMEGGGNSLIAKCQKAPPPFFNCHPRHLSHCNSRVTEFFTWIH